MEIDIDDPSPKSGRTEKRSIFEHILDTSSEEEDEGPEEVASIASTLQSSKSSTSRGRPTFDDNENRIIMAISMANHQLAIAYYNMSTSELFVMDDVVEDDVNYAIIKILYKQYRPNYVVLTTNAPESLVNALKTLILNESLDEVESSPSTSSGADRITRVVLKFLPKTDNTYEICYHRVNCLKLACEPENATAAERTTFLNSLLNFKSRLMIHALGLLLRYLDANWNQLVYTHSGQAEFVRISSIKIKDIVMIEEDTYKALNIMQSRFHPSSFKFGSALQGSSDCLYTFLNRCQSRSGAQLLWRMMRHPTLDLDVLNERYKAIEFFLHPDNQSLVDNLKMCLKDISHLTPAILNKYSTTQATAGDWNKFKTTLANIILVAEICEGCQQSAAIFRKIVESVTDEMHRIRYLIDYIIDLQLSKKTRQFAVNSGVDSIVDELRRKTKTLSQVLTDAATDELEKLPPNVQSCLMTYVPDIQYCLAITEWNGPELDDEDLPGLEFKFSINGVRHYKNAKARELDQTIGDIVLNLTRRQSQIMLRLIEFVGKHIDPVLKSIEYCAELDVLLSFAMVARDQNYTKPSMMRAHVISIKGGRHPLKELSGNYVANDTISCDEVGLIKMFTGPNACGKTLYMKQVGLIVYMAHIGCFVPAESAVIGVVTHILTQLPASESIAHNASSYLIDLRQVNNILYSSTPNSLILMDEFGKGTLHDDALVLLACSLKSFAERGHYCPHVFVTTHMHRIVELLAKTPVVQALVCRTFDFVFDDDQSLVFLYKLIPGNATRSFAHAVAQGVGLLEEYVKAAEEVFNRRKKQELPPFRPVKKRNILIRRTAKMLPTNGRNINIAQLKIMIDQAS